MSALAAVRRVLEEAAAAEARCDEERGRPEVLQMRLYRLRGKQAPVGDWALVPAKPQAWDASDMEEEVEEEADKPEVAEPPRKKPARKRPSERCSGRGEGRTCRFTQEASRLGDPARVDGDRTRCRLCDEASLRASLANPQ